MADHGQGYPVKASRTSKRVRMPFKDAFNTPTTWLWLSTTWLWLRIIAFELLAVIGLLVWIGSKL